MKLQRLEKIFASVLLVIFAGIVVHAPLSVGLGVLLPKYALLIKSWKEILMLLLVPVAAYLVTRRKLWTELLNDWIFRLIILYAALHFWIATIAYQGAKATIAGLAIDLRYVLFFCLVYVAIKLLPQWRRKMLIAATVGAFVVVCFAALQLFLPPDILKYIGYSKETIVPYLTVDKNPDYVRVNSTLRGPNPLGAYAGMILALLTAALVRAKLKLTDKKILTATLVLGVCSAISLWVSYSRSALVGGLIAVGVALAITLGRKLSRNSWVALSVVVFALAGAFVAMRGSSFVSNVLLHENPHGGSAISSNEGHVSSLQYGMVKLMQEPLGSGVGSTGSASLFGAKPTVVENQYLFVSHETGWLGLGLFLAFFVLILQRLWQRRADWLALGIFASGIGIGLIGLLLPVWVDDTVSIVWWGLAAIALARGRTYGKTTKQKTARTA